MTKSTESKSSLRKSEILQNLRKSIDDMDYDGFVEYAEKLPNFDFKFEDGKDVFQLIVDDLDFNPDQFERQDSPYPVIKDEKKLSNRVFKVRQRKREEREERRKEAKLIFDKTVEDFTNVPKKIQEFILKSEKYQANQYFEKLKGELSADNLKDFEETAKIINRYCDKKRVLKLAQKFLNSGNIAKLVILLRSGLDLTKEHKFKNLFEKGEFRSAILGFALANNENELLDQIVLGSQEKSLEEIIDTLDKASYEYYSFALLNCACAKMKSAEAEIDGEYQTTLEYLVIGLDEKLKNFLLKRKSKLLHDFIKFNESQRSQGLEKYQKEFDLTLGTDILKLIKPAKKIAVETQISDLMDYYEKLKKWEKVASAKNVKKKDVEPKSEMEKFKDLLRNAYSTKNATLISGILTQILENENEDRMRVFLELDPDFQDPEKRLGFVVKFYKEHKSHLGFLFNFIAEADQIDITTRIVSNPNINEDSVEVKVAQFLLKRNLNIDIKKAKEEVKRDFTDSRVKIEKFADRVFKLFQEKGSESANYLFKELDEDGKLTVLAAIINRILQQEEVFEEGQVSFLDLFKDILKNNKNIDLSKKVNATDSILDAVGKSMEDAREEFMKFMTSVIEQYGTKSEVPANVMEKVSHSHILSEDLTKNLKTGDEIKFYDDFGSESMDEFLKYYIPQKLIDVKNLLEDYDKEFKKSLKKPKDEVEKPLAERFHQERGGGRGDGAGPLIDELD